MTANIKAAVALIPELTKQAEIVELDLKMGPPQLPHEDLLYGKIVLSPDETRVILAALRDMEPVARGEPTHVVVPVEPNEAMLNAAIDIDSFKLGDISPLGFSCSPQVLFYKCYRAMLTASQEKSHDVDG